MSTSLFKDKVIVSLENFKYFTNVVACKLIWRNFQLNDNYYALNVLS